MKPSQTRRLFAVASLLAALVGCNSNRSVHPLALAEQAAAPGAVSAPSPVLEDEMRSDLYYLASDRLEGRGVGTVGLDLAADYIATRFESLGLKPLPGLEGYFQPFDITTSESIAAETSLAFGDKSYKVKQDFIPASFSAQKEFSGPVVFAGYGITNPDAHYDDYGGLDVKGKIVLILRFEPHDPATGKSRWAKDEYSQHSHLDVKAANAQSHGAAAVLMVNPPKYHFTGEDPLLPFVRQPNDTLSTPFLHITQKSANELLMRAGAPDLAELQKRLDEKVAPLSMELKDVAARGKVAINRTRKSVKNVAGCIPGVGPHANEYVVVGSHYDHLGWGGAGSLMNMPLLMGVRKEMGREGGGEMGREGATTQHSNIQHPTAPSPHLPTSSPFPRLPTSATTRALHHGADDNASGTATMLELARLFAHRAAVSPPERTLVFCAFTAEESGLIGSARFVNHPPIELKKIAAMLNLDMVGRIRKNLLYVGGGGTAEPFKGMLKQADLDSPLEFKSFGDGGMGPSDHMSFAVKKVPVIFLFSGTHEDYHRPTDTADKINFDGMAQVAAMSVKLIDEMVHMPMSKYVDAADKGSMLNSMTAGTGGETVGRRSASLGVVPEYGNDEDGKGVKIGGTSAGTAADKAGLQGGDIILQLGDKPTGTLMELSAVLASHKPGDKVKLIYQRAEKKIAVEVTLGARGG